MEKITIEHKGEDYYGLKYGDKYIEVSINEGNNVIALLKVIKNILNTSPYHNEVIK